MVGHKVLRNFVVTFMRHANWHTLRCCRQRRLGKRGPRSRWYGNVTMRERMFPRADHHGLSFAEAVLAALS
jgi:hypothetical protein